MKHFDWRIYFSVHGKEESKRVKKRDPLDFKVQFNIEKIKKQIIVVFKSNDMKIEIGNKCRRTDFLDLEIDLEKAHTSHFVNQITISSILMQTATTHL